jgi:hypothetical protein
MALGQEFINKEIVNQCHGILTIKIMAREVEFAIPTPELISMKDN